MFHPGFQPSVDELGRLAEARGCRILGASVALNFADHQPICRFRVDRRAAGPGLFPVRMTYALIDVTSLAVLDRTGVRLCPPGRWR
jgi:hypothetical protein